MRRMNRIFSDDGKAVIIAMDHGIMFDVLPDFENPAELFKKIIAGGADAILTTYGLAKNYEDTLKDIPLFIRADGGNTDFNRVRGGKLLYTVSDCLKLGAEGITVMGFPGEENENRTLENIAQLASETDEWNVPLMAEMLPAGFSDKLENNYENIKFAVRLGGELGADIIKTAYTGNVNEFKKIVKGSLAPVVVLGGSKQDDYLGVLKNIEEAVSAGASGVTIGRNVWKSKDPEKMTRALVDIIHNDYTAERAVEKQNL
ncbi:MAG: class I fructose-bisphosphate aldolase [Halanaerobium sp.]